MVITVSLEEMRAELMKSGRSRVLSAAEREAFFRPIRGLREKMREQLPPQKKPRLRSVVNAGK